MKISTQVLFIVCFSFAVGALAILFFYDVGFKGELTHISEEKTVKFYKQFEHHQDEVDIFLLSLITTVSFDEHAGELFLRRDRKGLYEHYKPLYEKLSAEFGLTHFYFHNTDGTVFLRLHDKDDYGDVVERSEFIKARKEGKPVRGISAGMTAFAFRMVSPYYYKGKMVGYIEMGQDADAFIAHVLNQLGSKKSMAIIVDKSHVSKTSWANFYKKRVPGFEWSTYNHFAVASLVGDTASFSACSAEKDIAYYFSGKNSETKYVEVGKNSICAGYILYDPVDNSKVGLVVTHLDLSGEVAGMSRLSKSILMGLVLPLVLSAFLLWLLVRASVTRPVNQLARVAENIAAGNFSERIDISTDDEVAVLVRAMNGMAAQLEAYKTNMELLVDMRTEELRHANDETIMKGEQLRIAFEQLENQTHDIEIAYKELEKVNTELKGLERIKTEFLQTISHELRSPLTPILGYLELMRDGDIGEFNSTQKEILQEMFMCARNLQLILDELLEAASIQAGRVFLDISNVDVKEVLKEVGDNMRKFADEGGIVIVNDFPKGALYVEGDRKRIYEIGAHLVRNAVKFSHKAGNVVIIASATDDGVEFSIKDEGIGISPDRLNKIFEAFYQIDSSSARFYEGVGLGLFLVRKLVDIHNGRIRVQSQENKGTTFTVFIPRHYKRTDV